MNGVVVVVAIKFSFDIIYSTSLSLFAPWVKFVFGLCWICIVLGWVVWICVVLGFVVLCWCWVG